MVFLKWSIALTHDNMRVELEINKVELTFASCIDLARAKKRISSIIFIVCSNKIYSREMLSVEGNENSRSMAKKNDFARPAIVFCTFFCRCFAQRKTF